MITSTKRPATNPTTTPLAPPIPARALLPSSRMMTGILTVGAAAFAVTIKRPKGLPTQAQLTADAITATFLGIHPVETLLLRRVLRSRNVTPSVRRRATGSGLAFGVFGIFRVLRAVPRSRRSR
jgi:hypothetical protein